MSEALFLLGGDGSLRTMTPAPFASEDVFQELLERHPALLTASRFGEAEPRRWVLVRREMAVADREDSAGRWSLDHLFLDQDGVPTLVEIKRASDTRARREVVAQMLDYAANAVSWWRVTELVEHFRETAAARGRTSQEMLAELLLDDSADEEAFWRKVQANLTSGRIRMLFVADIIHPELQRIVEFLNEQMNPAVVAAVELRPFAAGEDRLISPRIIGETQKAQALKRVADDGPLPTADEWLEEASRRWSSSRTAAVTSARQAFAAAGFSFAASKGGYNVVLDVAGRDKWMFTITSAGSLQVNFGNWTRLGRLRGDDVRMAVMARLNAIPGVALSTANASGFPTFNPERVETAEGWAAFKNITADVVAAARSQDPIPHA